MRFMNANMFKIPYRSQDFPSGRFATRGDLTVSWDDLLWSALTIGRPNTAYVFEHGSASLHEAIFRMSMMRMALELDHYELRRTSAFRALDPTEKGAVSYFLGMVVCKLFADKLLNTPWLLHLDVFREQLNSSILGGRSRPDLIGCDQSGDWYAFECKGRSSVPSSDDRRKAKEQAQRLVKVNSKKCSLNIGAITYFRQEVLEFYWRDPEPEEPEQLEPIAVELPLNAWAHYYAPALALHNYSRREEIADLPLRPEADIKVEIHPRIYEVIDDQEWGSLRNVVLEYHRIFQEEGFQQDGLKVIAGESWRHQREAHRVRL